MEKNEISVDFYPKNSPHKQERKNKYDKTKLIPLQTPADAKISCAQRAK